MGGWTEDMWGKDGTGVPESELTEWALLTPEERGAATRLCFFEELWNDLPITDWYDYDTGKNTAIQETTTVPKDINLEIFENTGYVGKKPGSIGASAYTVMGQESQSYRTL